MKESKIINEWLLKWQKSTRLELWETKQFFFYFHTIKLRRSRTFRQSERKFSSYSEPLTFSRQQQALSGLFSLGRVKGFLSLFPRPNHSQSYNHLQSIGETQLHIACIKNDAVKVKQLLAAGGDANSTDYAGWTPLHEACNHGNLESVRELLKSRQPVLEINSEDGTCFALQSVSADQILSCYMWTKK